MEYIVENALVLIPALNVLGAILKGFEKLPNKFIPVILLPFGVLGAMAIMGFTVEGAVQGILVTGAAVYGNQLVKQMKKKENGNDT